MYLKLFISFDDKAKAQLSFLVTTMSLTISVVITRLHFLNWPSATTRGDNFNSRQVLLEQARARRRWHFYLELIWPKARHAHITQQFHCRTTSAVKQESMSQ